MQTHSARLSVHSLLAAALSLAGVFAAVSAFGFMAPNRPAQENFDKRSPTLAALPAVKAAAESSLQRRLPTVRVDFDEIVHSPKFVYASDGFLSGPAGQGRSISPAGVAGLAANDPHRATKAFLREHSGLFGHGPEALDAARVRRDFVSAHNGLHTVIWEQQVDGIAVFEGRLISHTTKAGELVNISSRFLANPEQAATTGTPNRAALRIAPSLTAAQALAAAAQNLDETLPLEPITTVSPPAGDDAEKHYKFRATALAGDAAVQLVWLPLDADSLRLCWEVVLMSRARGEMFRVLVDVETGQPWLRRCLTQYLSDATYRVFTSDSPSPFSPGWSTPNSTQPPLVSRALVTLSALDTNASPNGWLDDGANETRGNNVDAHADRNNDNLPDLPRPQGSPFRVFDFPLDLNQSPLSYSNAAIVQLFYWNNFMHDRLYELGFTEAAGNFQSNNFGRGGLGGDLVQADAQDGGGTDNANFSTPPDGFSGRMQMYIFTGPAPDRDGDLDAEIILHEYTHGLSWRLVAGGQALGQLQSDGMGEGWSDFYALALLSEAGDDVNGVYTEGAYCSYMIGGGGDIQNYYFGIRRYPYTTDMTKNPLTFNDIDPVQANYCSSNAPYHTAMFGTCSGIDANEVHNQGEVWCVTLWEARAALINKYGWAAGNQLILQLVTDGMILTPPQPNFLQARDGILLADQVDNGGADLGELWAAFAKRGMGFSATSPSSSTTSGVREAFDLPDDLRVSPVEDFVIRGPVGGPFSPNSITLTLTNAGSNSLSWSLADNVSWLHEFPAKGSLLPGGPATPVKASLNATAKTLPLGVYPGTLWVTNLNSQLVQTRQFKLRVGQLDNFTELFDTTTNDLSFQTFTFTPDGSPNFYSVCRQPATAFPTDPTGGIAVPLSDDSSALVPLSGGNTVAIYNTRSGTFYIGSNGYLTMNSGDTTWVESFSSHFNLPRVSALFDDLNPAVGGTISRKQLADRVAVTYLAVPEYGFNASTNSFQIELFFDGRIRLTYLTIRAMDGLVGLSAGTGVPADFEESNFSTYGPCAPLVVMLPASASENAGVLANAGAVWLADVLPTNLVVSLTSSVPSRLTVPANTTILAGQIYGSFDLSPVDNSIHDADQAVVVTAGAAALGSGSNTLFILDDDIPPEFLSQPTARAVAPGEDATFDATVTGKLPLIYSWLRNDVAIPGANGTNYTDTLHTVYTLSGAQLSDAGAQFRCLVTNAFGSILSSNAVLTVVLPPAITTQPSSCTNNAGTTASFNVVASGATPLSYQWRRRGLDLNDGGRVSGATTPNLIVTNVQDSDAATYTVVITNLVGSITSAPAVLFVVDPPLITAQPLSRTNLAGTTASFIIEATGTSPLSYQWKRNDVDLPDGGTVSGATTPALTLSAVSPNDVAGYSILVSNEFGSILSSNAALSLVYGSVVVPWGDNTYGQTNVPAGLMDVTAISTGPDSYFCLALRANHTVVAWGDNPYGQTNVPAGLTNVVAIAAGGLHGLALKSDGTVIAWGNNDSGQTNLPVGLSNVAAIAAGYQHNLALKADGTVVAWGDNAYDQTNVPPALSNVVAVAGGSIHSLALRADGTVLAWGNNDYDQTNVPAGLSNVVAIAAGDSHNLALKADGTVIGWGWNGEGETDVPAGLSDVVAISGGYAHSLALKADGTVVAWGWNVTGETNVPAGLANVAAVAAGYGDSLALVNESSPIILKHPSNVTVVNGGTARLSVAAVGAAPLEYHWRKDGFNLSDGGNVSGSATSSLCLSNAQDADMAVYTVSVTNVIGSVTSSPATLTVLVPKLRIERDGNMLSIFWPMEPAGFALESSGSLSPPAWASAPYVPAQVGGEFKVQIPMSATSCFYRLRFNGL